MNLSHLLIPVFMYIQVHCALSGNVLIYKLIVVFKKLLLFHEKGDSGLYSILIFT